jgi:Fic family protein
MAAVGVRLDVAALVLRELPEHGDGFTAAQLELVLGLSMRTIVDTLNELRRLGHVRRLVEGDPSREHPVARWLRCEDLG